MTNDRPYRKALTDEVVIAEMQRISGSQPDPGLIKFFPVSFKDKVWQSPGKPHMPEARPIILMADDSLTMLHLASK